MPSSPGSRPSRLALAARCAVLLAIALLALRQVDSLDTGFHLTAGEHLLAGQGWPRTDPFTYTMRDHAYVDTSWGYQVVLALVHRGAGPAGIVLLHAALVLATFAVVLRTVRLAPAEGALVPAWLLLAALACEIRFSARPELLSYLLLAVVLHLLHRGREGRPVPWWVFPLLFLAWANLHALWILGLVAMAAFLVARPERSLALAAGASLAAVFVNPYGWRGVTFPIVLFTRMREGNVFKETIGEFASLPGLFRSPLLPIYRPALLAAALLCGLVALALVPALRRRRVGAVLVAAAFVVLSIRMVRNVPLAAVAGLPPLAWAVPSLRAPRARRLVPALVLLLALGLAARAATGAWYVDRDREERPGLAWNRLVLPVEAGAWAREARPEGRVLNHINFGGTLMWLLRPEPVFIDGRLEVVGETFYETYGRTLSGPDALETAVARWGIGWIVFPHKTNAALLAGLSGDPRWRLVHADALAAAFARAGSPTPPGPSASAFPRPPTPEEVAALPRPPGRLATWLSGFVRRADYPSDAFGLGVFHLRRGEPGPAAARFAEAVRASGGRHPELYRNLAASLDALGRSAEAAACRARSAP